LYLKEKAKKGDDGKVMAIPNPNDLPHLGAPWNEPAGRKDV
jgi:hypothetical protein